MTHQIQLRFLALTNGFLSISIFLLLVTGLCQNGISQTFTSEQNGERQGNQTWANLNTSPGLFPMAGHLPQLHDKNPT